MAAAGSKSVLFVCLGNICRSPIAEAVFRKLVSDEGISHQWSIDSAATSTYEIGNPPDYRGQSCMRKHGVSMDHTARQVMYLLPSIIESYPLCFVLQWSIDSAATSHWNVGCSPDSRAVKCLKSHSTETSHKARQITKDDFISYDYILCMDESNLRDLKRKCNQVQNCTAKIELLGSYDPQKRLIIEDPYYGSDEDFETVYQQCVRCCKSFLEKCP